jgi:hypothetical protein
MKKLFILSLLTVSCTITARALPTVAGDDFEVQWFYPDSTTVYDSDPSLAVPGTWTSVNDPRLSITLSDGQIVVNVTDGTTWAGGNGFNGFVFTDLSKVPDFTSLGLVSEPAGYTGNAPILAYTADTLSINFDATSSDTGNLGTGLASFTFDFTEAGSAVPEGSSTLMLLGMGLMALAGVRTMIQR